MENVSHRGKVISVTDESVTVEIISSSACAACHAKTLCSLSENVTKEVTVKTSSAREYQTGEEVEVLLAASKGHKAVLISYIAPLLIVVAVLLGASAAGANEYVAGLSALAAGGLWYLVIWLFRDRIGSDFDFKLKKHKA